MTDSTPDRLRALGHASMSLAAVCFGGTAAAVLVTNGGVGLPELGLAAGAILGAAAFALNFAGEAVADLNSETDEDNVTVGDAGASKEAAA
ncbi:hypothetical protein G9C85_00195 [Halorubellus sp. JP-L1]|uniref:hypothetical protein n=1 Tax=Halorubellus sp. JP-L1 TaxID=2715753 RepID=UPI00140DECC9|nr:hypothetical protein [Halorubellus sp. JP-L1]NHN40058.1 hypothetical protein [Halorubellus sp. JP-L1]